MPRDQTKGVSGGSGVAQRAAREVIVALVHPTKTVGQAALASVKRLRGRAAKSRTSTLDDHVYNDARVLSVATRMELHAWADGGTVKKIMKAVTKAKMYEALVAAHARRAANKKRRGPFMSLAAYAALAEEGFLKIDEKKTARAAHLEATPEKDDERAAKRARHKATDYGAKPLRDQSAKHRDKMMKHELEEKLRKAEKQRKQQQIERREAGKPFDRARLKCTRKAAVNPYPVHQQLPGRTRYYAKVFLRTKSGSLKKNRKGKLMTRCLTNNEPKSPANPDGGGVTRYFPSEAAAYAAVAEHEAEENAAIAADLAKKAAKE